MGIRKLLCYILVFFGFEPVFANDNLQTVTHPNFEDFLTQDPSTYFFDLGLFSGFILILLVYSFLIFVNVKQPLFLWFFVYTLLVSFYLGLTERWIVFFNEQWMGYFNIINSVFILYAFKSFFQKVLNTLVYFKLQHRWMDFLFLIAVGLVFLQLLNPHSMVLILSSRVIFALVIALVFYCITNNPELTQVQYYLLKVSIISLIFAGISMTLRNLSFEGSINFVLIGVLLFVFHILTYSMAVLYRIKKLSDKNESLWKDIRQVKTELMEAHFAGVKEEKLRILKELRTGVISEIDQIVDLSKGRNLDWAATLATLRDDTLQVSIALNPNRRKNSDSNFMGRLQKLIMDYKSEKTNFKLTFFNSEVGLNEGQESHVFKIIQEAFNNIEKYAKASEVELQVLQSEESFILSVEDNGVGFDPKREMDGIGLTNMKNRVLEMNGTFNVSSIKGKGTSIIISVVTK